MDINLGKTENKVSGPSAKNKIKDPKIKKKIIIISSVVGVLALSFVGATSYIYGTISKYENLIMPRVAVEGIDLSGQTMESAIKLVGEKYEKETANRSISIKAEDKEYSIKYTDINLKYDIENTVKDAFAYGRDLSAVKKYNLIKDGEDKNFTMEFTYNSDVIKEKVAEIEKEVNEEKRDATIKKASGDNFIIEEEKVGTKLDVQALIDDLNNKISSTKEGNSEVVAKLDKDVPKITKEQLSKINTVISTFNTTFGKTSTSSRATNITLGAKAVNGTLLMPGDQFSFNKIVGDTTPDKGYQKGGAYIGDEVVEDYGGGICQVSSTLHNAVLRAGILPDYRINHSMTVGYVPLGLDATIFYGGTDYTFSNSTQYPIYIEGYASNGNVYFNLYSNSALVGKTYSFPSETTETIAPPVKYEDDPNLEVGKEVVAKPGSNGYKVKAYRVTYENGKEIARELMNSDYYKPAPKVIKRGTKPVQPKETTPAPTPTPPTANSATPTTPTPPPSTGGAQ